MILRRPLAQMRILLLATFFAFIIIGSFIRLRTAEHMLVHDDLTHDKMWHTKPEGHIEFWQQLQSLMVAYQPICEPPLRLGDAPSIRIEQSDPDNRQHLLDMPQEDVERMKEGHAKFVDAIKSNTLNLHYVPGTRGIVSTAGGPYLPVLVISLRMLRRTGSQLPVEVFLAYDDEYEPFICDVVLPSLNARCVVLSHIFDAVPKVMDIEKYQFKIFAMLFSSFEEILFLDADSFPILQPESLFMNEPFKSQNMITWPDFWASTVSPYYYEIASQSQPQSAIRQSTESGEVLISKRTHRKTLLLTAFYNFWGPLYYYALLSQGAAGEGDKETFVTAALAVNEPYYQVTEGIVAIGHRTKGGLAGSAMVQFDPTEDYALQGPGSDSDINVTGPPPASPASSKKAPGPRPFFIHANYPKFNPATIFEKGNVNPAFADDGSYTRAWTIPEDLIENFGTDIERHYWKEILWTACELENKFRSWKGKKGICKSVKKYWNAMFANQKS